MKKLLALLPVLAGIGVFAAWSPAAPTGTVMVKETNFKITMAGKAKAGATTFVVKNASSVPHDFAVKGPGVNRKTPKIKPGGTARLTVKLTKGARYQIWCTVGGHSKLGMKKAVVAV